MIDKSENITSELDTLKNRANLMGIKFSPNIGIEALKARIEKTVNNEDNSIEETSDKGPKLQKDSKEKKSDIVTLSPTEFKEQEFNKRRKECNRLIRCNITCLDSNKKNFRGEIISVGSSKLGTFKKYVPYNTGEPYHLPQILFDELKARKHTTFVTIPGRNGKPPRKEVRMVNSYAIEELPPISKEELKELSKQQAMKEGN